MVKTSQHQDQPVATVPGQPLLLLQHSVFVWVCLVWVCNSVCDGVCDGVCTCVRCVLCILLFFISMCLQKMCVVCYMSVRCLV